MRAIKGPQEVQTPAGQWGPGHYWQPTSHPCLQLPLLLLTILEQELFFY